MADEIKQVRVICALPIIASPLVKDGKEVRGSKPYATGAVIDVAVEEWTQEQVREMVRLEMVEVVADASDRKKG
jgi:hypothetical protein